MKKTFLCLIFSLLLLFNLFSADISLPSGVGYDSDASLQVYVDIPIINLFYYSFGFSDEPGEASLSKDNANIIPGTYENVVILDYDPDTSIAYSYGDLYMYYKARTSDSFYIALDTNGYLVPDNDVDPLGWNVTITSVNLENGSSNSFGPYTIDEKSTRAIIDIPVDDVSLRYGSYVLDIETDIIPLLAEETTYSGKLTMTVATK